MSNCRDAVALIGLLAWALAGAMPLCASEPASASATNPQTKAARLLSSGARYSPCVLAEARADVRQLRGQSWHNPAVQYALALVLIQQHAHADATELLDDLIAQQPGALHLWRTRIWSKVTVHDDRAALADVRALSDVLAEQGAADLPAADAEEWAITVEFLGRIVGFLASPHAGARPADEVDDARQYVLGQLGNDRPRFERGEQLRANVPANARPAQAVRPPVSSSTLEQIHQQLKAVDEAEADLNFERETARLAAIDKVKRANQSVDLVCQRMLISQFELNYLRPACQANRMTAQMQYTAYAMGGMSNPYVLAASWQTAQLANSQRCRLRSDASHINQLIRQLPRTMAWRDEVVATAGDKLQELNRQATRVKRQERRLLERQQAEIKKIAAANRRELPAKQISFAALEPFPFEIEKERVLKMIGP